MHKLEVFQRIQRSRINVGQLVHVVLQRVARLEEFSSASKVMFVERKEIPFIASNIFLFLQHPFLLRWCFKTPSSSFVWCKHETRQVFYMWFFFCIWLKLFSLKIRSNIFTNICSAPKMNPSCSENTCEFHGVFWSSNEAVGKRGILRRDYQRTGMATQSRSMHYSNLTMLEIPGTVQGSSGSTPNAHGIDSGTRPIVQNY